MLQTCKYPDCSCQALEGDKDNFCLFHSKDDNKDINAFVEGIKEKLERGDYNFGGYRFPETFPKGFFVNREFNDANFGLTVFKGSIAFGAQFSGESTDFSGAEFSGKSTDFSRAQFSGKSTDFSVAEFSGERTYFSGAKFSGESTDFGGAQFSGKRTYFSRAKFSGEVVFHTVNLDRCRFYDTDLRRVKFINCNFALWEGYKPFSRIPSIKDRVPRLRNIEFFQRPNVLRDEIEPNWHRDFGLLARSYQQLKKYYETEERDHALAGEFFYGEMECKRKAGEYWPFLFLYKILSGYGERHRRALFWLLLFIVVLFPRLYMWTGIYVNEPRLMSNELVNEVRESHDYLDCLMHSVYLATFQRFVLVTIEQSPNFPCKVISAVESILGPLQIALFALALRAKLRK